MIDTGTQLLFVYDLKTPEIFVPKDEEGNKMSRKATYPAEWQNQFGVPVSEHQNKLQVSVFNGHAVFSIEEDNNHKEGSNGNDQQAEPQSLSADMLKGIAKMVSIYQDELNDDAFKERLSRVSVKEIVRTAKERQAGSRGFVEALLLQYNKKTRYPLLWEKLYDHNNRHRREPIPEEVQEADVDSDDVEDDEE